MKRSHFFGFLAIEISYWCFHAAFAGYVASYLLENGMSSSVLGLINSAYLICAFAGSFLFGGLCDHFHTNRKVFLAGALGTTILTLLIYFHALNQIYIIILYTLFGFILQPMASNMDAWVLRACNNDMSVYGQIRSVPCAFNAVTGAIFGSLILRGGYMWMLIGGLFFLAATFLSAWLLPDFQNDTKETARKLSKSDFLSLLKNPPYIKLLVIIFLVGCASIPLNNLRAIIIEYLGGNVGHIGIHSLVCAMTQVPFIFLSGKILKISRRNRYILMCGLTFLHLCLAFFANSVAIFIFSAFFSNVGYSILLITMREATENSVPKHLHTFGHSLSEAVYTSFSGAVGLSYTGVIAEKADVPTMIAVCLVIGFIPLVISLWPEKAERH